MAAKIQLVEMQSASFWTVRYQTYTMMNIDIGQKQELNFIDEEKDLGVIVDSKLKFSSHIVNQVKKANKLMGLIRRSFSQYCFIQVFLYFSCLPSS